MPFVSFDMISYAAGLQPVSMLGVSPSRTLAGINPGELTCWRISAVRRSAEDLGRATWAWLGTRAC